MSKTTIPTAGLADDAVDLTSKVTGTLPTANGGTGATSFTAGITEIDHFRLSSGFTGDAAPIASNLERVDTSGLFEKTGTGMTESSGVFTFPSTGKYRIDFIVRQQISGSGQYNEGSIYYTTDNSSYNLASGSSQFISQVNSTTTQAGHMNTTIFDVTNVSTHKVRFHVEVQDNSTSTVGSTSETFTAMVFLRLGDT
jgi:hypothetical protein